MGKRTFSLRRYFSRAARGLSGTLHSERHSKSPEAEIQTQTGTETETKTMTPEPVPVPVPDLITQDLGSSDPLLEVKAEAEAETKIDEVVGVVVPVTKIPALDTLDAYAAGEQAQPIDGVDRVGAGRSQRITLACSSSSADVCVLSLIDAVVAGYARFVLALTGLEDAAFYSTSRSPFTATTARNIVLASRGRDGVETRSLAAKDEEHDEVQFYAELGSAGPGNGHDSPLQNAFILFVEPDVQQNVLHINFTYPRRLIPPAAVDQLLRTLSLHIAESSTAFTQLESQPALSVLNFPPSMIPPAAAGVDSLLHSPFEHGAREHPDRIALDFVHSLASDGSESEHSILTYAALDTAASNLASHIASLLPRNSRDDGHIIPVHMPTSPELYISYLAVLKAGHAFCPIPQDAPSQRIQEIIHDINSPIILGNTPEPKDTPSTATWVNVTEASRWKALQGDSHTPVSPSENVSIDGDQTAYLLFTSGSTGKPKGVQVSHLAASCSISSHATTILLPGKERGDFRWFQFASPSFDPSLMEIFVTLSSGGTLCSADRRLTLANLEPTINEARATVMMATPSLAALLRPERLTTLEALWSMGEKLNRTVIDNFSSGSTTNGDTTSRHKMLVNAYGPTEGAINCTYVSPFERYMRGTIIGKPLPTCAMLILSPDSQDPVPVPAGTVGELAIGGPQVSKGYLNRPEETAKAFVHSDKFGKIYRTGDKARIVWDESGAETIEYLGRMSTDQVKVNGRRVELGEIESVIANVPGVTEVVAVVTQRVDKLKGAEQIVAFLVSDDETKHEGIIRLAKENAAKHLASFLCPSAYTFVDALPRLSSGKVDRKALAAGLEEEKTIVPAESGYSSDTLTNWEETEDENMSAQQLVVRLLAETTDTDASKVTPHTELYSIGIDSLGAMRLLQQLKDNGVDGLSVSDVLQSQTCQGLVSLVQAKKTTRHARSNNVQRNGFAEELEAKLQSFQQRHLSHCAESLDVPADTIKEVLPTTASQSGMISSFMRSQGNDAYEKPTYIYHTALPLQAEVQVETLKQVWSEVIANYDSFRTAFAMVDDDMSPFAQCILAPETDFKVDWVVYTNQDQKTENDLIEQAIRNAEHDIRLDRPPWKLSLVESSTRTVLILSMFHGIFDGGSLDILLNDVSSHYHGQPLSKRTPLDHVVKHHFQADQASTGQFWRDYLQGVSVLPFPSVTPTRTPAQRRSAFVEVTSALSHEALKSRSRSIGSTPLSVLQAAWGAILLSYTGTPDLDVVMGNIVSGRLDQASQACVGPTFTVTPLRISIHSIKKDAEILTNKSLARYLCSSNATALSHLQAPLGSATVEDKLSYDTMLAYQDFGSICQRSQPWSSIQHPAMANDFSVMVEVVPGPDSSLTLRVTFDTKLDAPSAEMMLRQMDDIIGYILEQPDASFEDAALQARSGLKSIANPNPLTAPEVSEGVLLHTQFEEHAFSHPDDPALIFKEDLDDSSHPGNVSWTYAELNAMADSLADKLIELCGDLTEKSVPICIDKSPALYVAILGILKAGGAWCPIDVLSPAQRRHDLIARTSSGILLVSQLDGPQPDGAVPAATRVLDVSSFCTQNAAVKESRQSTKCRATPSNMAYLIWTSGTTGAPKGVPITHCAAVSSFKSLQTDIPGNEDGSTIRCMQFSQATFDVSIQDLFYAWGLGGVLISATREILLQEFAKLANTTQATHAHLTPAFASGVPRESCKTLKVVTMIGEKLTPSVADDWGTNMRAFNTYGPAEATIVSTIREFGNEHKAIKSANIGWPMETVSAFVMRGQRIVMQGAIGELALGGPQLSPGYLNQADVTAAKYVWNEEANQRLYFTGDLVRMLSDGSLEYITRVDDLVKLGGIRIELSEISFALRGSHPLLENVETFMLDRPDRPTKVIVAFLCASQAGEDDGQLLVLNETAKEIARATSTNARTALPEYMIPSVYLVLRSIPKTPSAKIDRRALQAAYAAVDIEKWESEVDPDDSSDFEDETDVLRTRVVEAVAALANVDPAAITKQSRLRSLGVDSLRATRLAFRLKEAGYDMSVMNVLACYTVQDLIKLARSSEGAQAASADRFDVQGFDSTWHEAVAAKVHDGFIAVRVTAIQESLLTETMGTYNMYWSNHFVRLDRTVDIARLRQAWLAVCQKTEALRTGFIPVAETQNTKMSSELNFSILQLIYDLPALDWESYECSEGDWMEKCHTRVEEIMTRHQKNYFRLPPWAVTVFDLGDERVMVFTVHHSVHDEPSLRFIFDDVRAAYTSKPSPRSQHSDALSLVLASGNRYDQAVGFWQSELKPFAALDSPVWPDLTGKRVTPGVTPEYQLISEEIPMTESVQALQSLAGEMGLQSIAAIIRAAWAYVSLSYLGLPATVLAETLSDRVFDSSLESTIGPLISVVPVPFQPKGTVREVLLDQHRISVQSWKHRHVHARDIRKALDKPRGEPLYPAVFNFHAPDESADQALPEIWTELEDKLGLHVEHPMAMNVFQSANGAITLEASSDSRIFSPEHLRLFVRQIDSLITGMLSSPDVPFASLVSGLPSDLRSLSNREVSENVANSIYQAPTHWLEKFAGTHPDWTAVEVASSITTDGIEKEAMSYATLNAAANRVAAYLASFGHKNRVIGISTSRTLASYPVIIGIFKSGNTYLPIDESLPADRKAFLIEDSNSPIVFTETAFSESFSGVPDTCRVECIDDSRLQDSIAAMPSENQDYGSHPDDTSYLLFTSGSTGKPKGVMVTRANLSSFIESISEFACQIAPATLDLGGTGRYLAQANRAFDPHLLEMFFPWRHGMATVTAPRPMILDDIGTTLSKWDITHASFVPSLVDQSNITPEQCPKLRFMTVGGEKITQKVLDTWASAPNVAIVNAYGPTEVTIGCTFAHINASTNLRNIGPPLTACTAHVLLPETMDYSLRGQTGELCFSGDLVARGYLNRPDAKGFLTGPDGVKMYRTGDIGRLMADGSVEYLGRGDDQTKIRGQRLELGEVSEVLRASSPVSIDVVTTVAKHPKLAKVQLLSFVSRSHKRSKDAVDFVYSGFASLGRELQDICRQKLPGYMVPELILPISSIPIAPMSGKANMKELHRLFADLPLQTVLQGNSAAGTDAAAQRPLNADEEAVVNEICHVVSIESSTFTPLTNIFEIGLDSLSAIGLSIRLRGIGYAASVALVMSNPVVEQLASLPRSESVESGENKLRERCQALEFEYRQTAVLDIEKIETVRPCLPLQEGLVARSMNSNEGQAYVNHVTLRLEGVDGEKLKRAWEAMINENEILRTVFASLEREIAQVVLKADSVGMLWTESQYESLEAAVQERGQQKVQISREMIADISSAPPVRFHLATSDNNPVALFISIHHALYDGESFSMMLDDVAARYQGKGVPERGSPSIFLEHVCLQDTEKAKQHWTQTLSGSSPTLFRHNSEAVKDTVSVHRRINMKLSDLESRSASLQTTVPNLMQAVFALLLADHVGSADVTYGVVLSGRAISAPGADSVLLPCITTVPARLNTNNLQTINEVVNAVQKATVRSLDYQHTPLRKIQAWLKSEIPLFDSLFSFIRSTATPEHNLWEELDSHMPSEYPLALEVQADSATDSMSMECIFSSDFGPHQTGEEFLDKIDAVLSDLVSGGTLSLDNFNLANSQSSGPRPSASQWDESTWTVPETKIRELTSVFCGLDIQAVSKGASFLSLGIDSVTAIQFARRLRDEGFKVSSSDIMRFSCVGSLASHVESSSQPQVNGVKELKGAISVADYGKDIPLLGAEDSITSMFECTPLQSGMITQTISSGGKVYVNPHPMRLNQSVDVEKLKSALHQVVQMNEILRTSFHVIPSLGESWIGAVHRDSAVDWTEITLSSSANVLSEVMSLYSFDAEDFFQSPPIRSVLVHQPDCRVLVIILHHSLYDGASLPFFFEDLATIYSGQSASPRPQFSEIVPYVLDNQEESCKFWADRLQDYQPVEIPPLESSSTSMLSSEHRIPLDVEQITQSCKDMEITIQSASLLAYAKVYAQLVGSRDVVLGQVLSGRILPHPDADRTLGPLFNTVAQRVTLDPKFLNNKALAQRLQQQSVNAQNYQHAPLRVVQNTLRQSGQLGSAQLFDALFVFQKSAALSGGALDSQDIWTPFQDEDFVVGAEYKLNIEVDQTNDGIVVSATSNGQYINQEMLDTILRDFDDVFCDIIENPTKLATHGLGDLPLRKQTLSQEPVLESEVPEHETLIQSVLADVGGIPVEEIKPNTSIFNLGLDSLSAIRIASVCRSKGLKVGVADILQGNTLRGISTRVKPVASIEESPGAVKDYPHAEEVLQKLDLKEDAVETILPCLPGQTHHLASWLKSGRTMFEPAWAFFSRERLDNEKLQNAWVQLQQRHPVLRTVFATASEAVQVILKNGQGVNTFKVVESSDRITELAQAQARHEALHPSSLYTPPVRLRLLKAADQDGILIIIHHALYDAWSMPMLVSELGKLYNDQTPDTTPDFPAFVDETLRSLSKLDEKAYWTESLKDSTPTVLTGANSHNQPNQLFVSAWQKVSNLSSMESTCRAAGLSLQTIVLLAVARCLAKLTGVESPAMGLYQTGRSASFNGIEKLAGPCLNVNPFIVRGISPAASGQRDEILEQAKNIQTALAQRVSYEQSGLRDILRWAGQGNTPLFNTWVNLLWMQGGVPSATEDSKQSDPSPDLFQPLRIGVPTDFIPSTPLPLSKTPIDDLETSYLPEQNIFLDIGPDLSSDTLGFGVRVEGGCMDETEVRAVIDDVAGEIEGVVSLLS
ncbi:hypothetical protein BDV18DRAFT_119415 [Aspergillus unguis]